FGVADGFADANADTHFGKSRHLHRVLIVEVLHQSRYDIAHITLVKSRLLARGIVRCLWLGLGLASRRRIPGHGRNSLLTLEPSVRRMQWQCEPCCRWPADACG